MEGCKLSTELAVVPSLSSNLHHADIQWASSYHLTKNCEIYKMSNGNSENKLHRNEGTFSSHQVDRWRGVPATSQLYSPLTIRTYYFDVKHKVFCFDYTIT